MASQSLRIPEDTHYTINIPIVSKGENVAKAPEIQRILTLLEKNDHVVVFSPHLDDAILSMGSLIDYLATQKKKILVVSLFTSGSDCTSKLTGKLLQQASVDSTKEYFIKRQQEDYEAFTVIDPSIQLKHLGFIDAAWRADESNLPYYPNTTLSIINEQDTSLKERITESVRQIQSELSNAIIFAPLGRGRHVDHVLTREVCLEVFNSIVFYSDFPYSAQYQDESEFISKNSLVAVTWERTPYVKKREAILRYRSQYKSLFSDKGITLPYETFYIQKS